MAIIVEDGSGVANANSYNSEAELTAFATDRGITLTADEDVLLIKAMDYIESLNYIGYRTSTTQALSFPRTCIVIDGVCIDSDEIPPQLKKAQLHLAVAIDGGYNPLATSTQGIKRKRVDVIEVEYMDGSSAAPVIKSVNAYLAPLINGGGRNVIRVNKA